eukprot:TRINITY_DN4396_c2_g5_i1.p1 TRINITY_DN4396_c2_g5~~TRINITY_DN4396_c2_g5_i1.p1  ORF type:complete len:100 (+),score=19.21 TRINITY_DN4396_c2_g5_i1:475-774(+)
MRMTPRKKHFLGTHEGHGSGLEDVVHMLSHERSVDGAWAFSTSPTLLPPTLGPFSTFSPHSISRRFNLSRLIVSADVLEQVSNFISSSRFPSLSSSTSF